MRKKSLATQGRSLSHMKTVEGPDKQHTTAGPAREKPNRDESRRTPCKEPAGNPNKPRRRPEGATRHNNPHRNGAMATHDRDATCADPGTKDGGQKRGGGR
jgi:hypothetical protein